MKALVKFISLDCVCLERMFHGTDEATVSSIVHQGLDPLRAHNAKNGSSYGKGTYLARDSATSRGYASPNSNNERNMFVCRALIGRVWYIYVYIYIFVYIYVCVIFDICIGYLCRVCFERAFCCVFVARATLPCQHHRQLCQALEKNWSQLMAIAQTRLSIALRSPPFTSFLTSPRCSPSS